MAVLRVSDLEEITGLSMRYWQRRVGAGEVPGAKELVCGRRRVFLIDAETFKAWWAREAKPICRGASGSVGASIGSASTTRGGRTKAAYKHKASPSLANDLKQFVDG